MNLGDVAGLLMGAAALATATWNVLRDRKSAEDKALERKGREFEEQMSVLMDGFEGLSNQQRQGWEECEKRVGVLRLEVDDVKAQLAEARR